MKKILLLLLNYWRYSFTTDKKLHALVGALLGSVGYLVTYKLTYGNRLASCLVGICLAWFVGFLKEVYDSRDGGSGFNDADLIYTILGGIVFSVITDLLV